MWVRIPPRAPGSANNHVHHTVGCAWKGMKSSPEWRRGRSHFATGLTADMAAPHTATPPYRTTALSAVGVDELGSAHQRHPVVGHPGTDPVPVVILDSHPVAADLNHPGDVTHPRAESTRGEDDDRVDGRRGAHAPPASPGLA